MGSFKTIPISIHKALAGLDMSAKGENINGLFISIHKALAGLDLIFTSFILLSSAFQSTRPSRASTHGVAEGRSIREISIHKALAGLDGYIVGNVM